MGLSETENCIGKLDLNYEGSRGGPTGRPETLRDTHPSQDITLQKHKIIPDILVLVFIDGN